MSYEIEKRKGAFVFERGDTRYRVCTQCIMDTTDPEIEFDDDGICSHCHEYDRRVATEVFNGTDGRQRLAAVVARIKAEGEGKRYDCVLGLSGGVDSTYVAYLTKRLGLRPLGVHLDNGWNSEIAVRNIENIVRLLDIDLYTRVLEWDEFRRLQVAFLKASTPDSEIPTDHAIVATLFQIAAKQKVRWIMDGSNVVTEIMVPATWSHGHSDWGYIKHLNDTFGDKQLKTYPHYTYYDNLMLYQRIKGIQRFPILNYIEYDKMAAMEVLKKELGWVPYGGKHYESIYTRFYQGYILPSKFGFDKRRSHLSCLIRDGRVTRERALAEMQQPPIDDELLREDRAFVIKKLGLTEDEFEDIMRLPRKTFWDYPSDERDISKTPAYWLLWKGYAVAKMARAEARNVARGLIAFPAFVLRAPKAIAASPSGFARELGVGTARVVYRKGLRIIRPFIPAVRSVLHRTLPEPAFKKVKDLAQRIFTLPL
jgi:N-acetyl sugar amidotransferase